MNELVIKAAESISLDRLPRNYILTFVLQTGDYFQGRRKVLVFLKFLEMHSNRVWENSFDVYYI